MTIMYTLSKGEEKVIASLGWVSIPSCRRIEKAAGAPGSDKFLIIDYSGRSVTLDSYEYSYSGNTGSLKCKHMLSRDAGTPIDKYNAVMELINLNDVVSKKLKEL